jgi:hypothetical protein
VFIAGGCLCEVGGSCDWVSVRGVCIGDNGGGGGVVGAVCTSGVSRGLRMISSGSLGGKTFGVANDRVICVHRFLG